MTVRASIYTNICKPGFILSLAFAVFLSGTLCAQELPFKQKRIFFPHPMNKKTELSLGFIATTLIHEITEEVRFRIPAADIHFLRNIKGKWYLDSRLNIQVFQNSISLGPRWATKLSDRLTMGLGNDFAFWVGFINQQGYKTNGRGFLNQPNISFGYLIDKNILLSVKAESLMSFGKNTYAGGTRISRDYKLFNGSSYTVSLEQPFFADKTISLSFRAIYTNFLWQTWALFQNYDRNLFYPQVIVGVIL